MSEADTPEQPQPQPQPQQQLQQLHQQKSRFIDAIPEDLRYSAVLAFNFWLVFIAYGTVQNYSTSVNGRHGYYALACVYVVYCLSSLVAPAVVRRFSSKYLMMLSCVVYVLFCVASIFGELYTLLLAAAALGIAASILFVAQQTYITQISSSPSVYGRNNGVFNGIRLSNLVVGNVFAGVFFLYSKDYQVLFAVLCVICAFGVVSFFLLKNIPAPNTPIRLQSLLETVRLFGSVRMLLTATLGLYLGASPSLLGGQLATRMPRDLLGFAFAVYGCVQLVAGLTLGPLSDRAGRLHMLFLGFLCSMCGIAAVSYATSERRWVFFLVFVAFGVGDVTMLTQLLSILPVLQPTRIQAISGFRLAVQCLSTSVMFFISTYLQFEVLQLILVVLLVGGIVQMYVCDRFVAEFRVRPPATTTPSVAASIATPTNAALTAVQMENGVKA